MSEYRYSITHWANGDGQGRVTKWFRTRAERTAYLDANRVHVTSYDNPAGVDGLRAEEDPARLIACLDRYQKEGARPGRLVEIYEEYDRQNP